MIFIDKKRCSTNVAFVVVLLLTGLCAISTKTTTTTTTTHNNMLVDAKKSSSGGVGSTIPDQIKAQVEAMISEKMANGGNKNNIPGKKHLQQVEEVKTLVQEKEQEKIKKVVKEKAEIVQEEKEQEQEKEVKCEDEHLNKVECKEWAWFGECEKNTEFMNKSCKKSCGLCPKKSSSSSDASLSSSLSSSSAIEVASSSSEDNDNDDEDCHDWFATCTEWAEKGNDKVDNLCHGHWHSNKGTWLMTGAYVVESCPKACNTCDIHLDDRDIALNIGLPQSFPGMDEDKELRNLIKGKVAETRTYIDSLQNDEIKAVCKMSHPNCARFALSSDCDDQVDHPVMKYGCAAACQTCETLIDNNGIFEAEHMWTNALRDFNEKKSNVVKRTIEVAAA